MRRQREDVRARGDALRRRPGDRVRAGPERPGARDRSSRSSRVVRCTSRVTCAGSVRLKCTCARSRTPSPFGPTPSRAAACRRRTSSARPTRSGSRAAPAACRSGRPWSRRPPRRRRAAPCRSRRAAPSRSARPFQTTSRSLRSFGLSSQPSVRPRTSREPDAERLRHADRALDRHRPGRRRERRRRHLQRRSVRGRRKGQRGDRDNDPSHRRQVSVGPSGRVRLAWRKSTRWLRAQGFFEGGADGLVADVYLGYALSRFAAPDGDAGPAGAVSAAAGRSRGSAAQPTSSAPPGAFRIGAWERSWTDAEYAAAVDAVRAAIAAGDVYQVNLVQHLSAPFAGDPAGLAGCARAAPPARAAAARRRRLGDRLRLARALPRPARATRVDAADQGNAPAGLGRRPRRLREGRGRERDDRRPRAQRPLARVRARQRALARADGGASARRRRPPRLDRRGAACGRTSASQS